MFPSHFGHFFTKVKLLAPFQKQQNQPRRGRVPFEAFSCSEFYNGLGTMTTFFMHIMHIEKLLLKMIIWNKFCNDFL